MPDTTDGPAVESAELAVERAELVEPSAGLRALLEEARQTWIARAGDPQAAGPGWRPFEDAFPTFYQFTNRPR